MTRDTTIRPACAGDHPACERLIRDAFWNLYRRGCHEHHLWHLAMRGHLDVVEPLTFVATVGDEIVGCIMSTRAHVTTTAGDSVEVLAPGPVAVAPAHQHHGIGALLIETTLSRARAMGYPAAFLYGNPRYYPRFGFVDAAAFHVTTAEGENFPDFMGAELRDGALAGTTGRLVESCLFEVDQAVVDRFDERFPPRSKRPRSGRL